MLMFKNAVNNLGISFSDAMIPTMRSVIEKLQGLVTWFDSLSAGTKQTIVNVGLVTAALGPVLVVIGKTMTAVGSITESIGKVSKRIAEAGGATGAFDKILSGLTTTAGVVGIGLTALALVVATISKRNQEAAEKARAFAEGIQSVGEIAGGLSPQLMDISALLSASGESMSDLETRYREVQTAITDILSTALSEQRALRADELESIRAHNEELLAIEEEKLTIHQQRQNAILTSMRLEMESMTLEDMAQYRVNFEASLEEATNALQEAHLTRIASITTFHQAMGTLDSEAHQQELQAEQARYSEEKAAMAARNLDLLALESGYLQSSLTENQQHWNSLVAETEKFSTTGKGALESFYLFLTQNNQQVANANQQLASTLDQNSLSIAASYLQALLETKKYGGELTDEQKQTAQTILSVFDGLIGPMGKTGTEIMRGLVQGQESLFPEIINANEMNADQIIQAYLQAFDMHSPSVVMTGIGENIGQGLIDGITNQSEAVLRLIQTLGTNIIETLRTSLIPTFQTSQKAIEDARQGMHSKIPDARAKANEIGQLIVEGIWAGIESKKGWLASNISAFIDSIIAQFQAGFEIHSPSRKMETLIGYELVRGMAAGIEKNAPLLTKAMEKVSPEKLAASFQRKIPQSLLTEAQIQLDTQSSTSLIPGSVRQLQMALQEMQRGTNQSDGSIDALSGRDANNVRPVELGDATIEKLGNVLFERIAEAGDKEVAVYLGQRELGRSLREMQAMGAI